MSAQHRVIVGLLLVCVATFGLVQRASAHSTGGCGHNHVAPADSQSASTCKPGATCFSGICTEETWGPYIMCVCNVLSSYNVQIVYSFMPEVAGLPAENTRIKYAAFLAEVNAAQVLLGDDVLGFFGNEEAALAGGFTLSFGSFADPESVPVSLDEVFLRMPSVPVSGTPTGPTVVTLAESVAAAPAQALVYNATTGVIEPANNDGLQLSADNQLDTGLPTTAFVTGQVNSGGQITLLVVGNTAPPTIPAKPKPQRTSIGQRGRQPDARRH